MHITRTGMRTQCQLFGGEIQKKRQSIFPFSVSWKRLKTLASKTAVEQEQRGGVSKQAREPHTSEDMSHNELLEVSSQRENTEGHFECLDAGVTRHTRQNLLKCETLSA